MASSIHSITFGSADHKRLGEFWVAALDLQINTDEYGTEVFDRRRQRPRLLFLPVPEGKTAKNRVHLDLKPAEGMEEEVDRLVGLGASVVRVVNETSDGRIEHFTVLLGPESNEFCVELP